MRKKKQGNLLQIHNVLLYLILINVNIGKIYFWNMDPEAEIWNFKVFINVKIVLDRK